MGSHLKNCLVRCCSKDKKRCRIIYIIIDRYFIFIAPELSLRLVRMAYLVDFNNRSIGKTIAFRCDF